MMTIHPDYQHHGAGTQIMKWSTELAERLGAQVNLDNARSARMIMAYTESRQMTVEASEAGRHLYEEHGFRVTETIELSVPEKWAEKPKVRFDFMKRPANGTSSWKSIDQVKVL